MSVIFRLQLRVKLLLMALLPLVYYSTGLSCVYMRKAFASKDDFVEIASSL